MKWVDDKMRQERENDGWLYGILLVTVMYIVVLAVYGALGFLFRMAGW